MRVQILDTAEEDLVEGYWFYEMQQPGLGAYFRNSIYADLHALEGRQESIESFTRTIIVRWLRGSLCVVLFRLRTNSVCTRDRGLPPRANVDQKTSGISSSRRYRNRQAGSSPPPIST